MLKRTRRTFDLWIARAITHAKLAALTGVTFRDVVRAAISRRASPEGALAKQLSDFLASLRTDQVSTLVGMLDLPQKLAFMDVANTITQIVEPHTKGSANVHAQPKKVTR